MVPFVSSYGKISPNLACSSQNVGMSPLAGCLNVLQLLTPHPAMPRAFLECEGANCVVPALFPSLLLLQRGQRVWTRGLCSLNGERLPRWACGVLRAAEPGGKGSSGDTETGLDGCSSCPQGKDFVCGCVNWWRVEPSRKKDPVAHVNECIKRVPSSR